MSTINNGTRKNDKKRSHLLFLTLFEQLKKMVIAPTDKDNTESALKTLSNCQ
jgi:hypothetical protein